MKRATISILAVALTFGAALIPLAAEDKKANELMEAALTKETIEGDLKGAISLYEQASKEAGTNRALAAKAQLRLAAAHQKQGTETARTIYERVVREYGDLTEVASEAQARLNGLRSPNSASSQVIAARNATISAIESAFNQIVLAAPANTPPNPRQITLFDRQGKVIATVGEPGPPGTMSISPDGKRVALVRQGKILVFDVKAQVPITLTNGPTDSQPAWSSDGKRIVFEVRAAQPGRNTGLYTIPSDGTGKEEYIAPSPGSITLISISADNRYLTYQMANDLYVLPTTGDRKPIPILTTPASEMGLRISPDGRYISYRFSVGGRTDVYVSPFDPTHDATTPIERWKVSGDVGVAVAGVRWKSDSTEIYYLDVAGGMNAVTVTTTPSFKASAPRILFRVPAPFQNAPNTTAGLSDVTADGQIFALMVPR